MATSKTERRIQQYLSQGWAPAPWAHHPAEVKAALRTLGFRPGIKECFANSQRFILEATLAGLPIAGRLEYREGWCQTIIPIEHAWLHLDGVPLDLTLPPEHEREYLDSTGYTVEQVRTNVVRTGAYTAIDQMRMHEQSPWRAAMDALNDIEKKSKG